MVLLLCESLKTGQLPIEDNEVGGQDQRPLDFHGDGVEKGGEESNIYFPRLG